MYVTYRINILKKKYPSNITILDSVKLHTSIILVINILFRTDLPTEIIILRRNIFFTTR